MKQNVYIAIIFLVLFSLFSVEISSSSPINIEITSPTISQGELCLLTIIQGEQAGYSVVWNGKDIAGVVSGKNNMWIGFIGADLTLRTGRYKLRVASNRGGEYTRIIDVVPKKYGIRRLTVPREMEALDAKTLRRVKAESRKMKELFLNYNESPSWRGAWLRPLSGPVVSPFGCRSIINGIGRSPHSGVDLKAQKGTPVKTTNNGKVVMVANHFFSGKNIVVDHGGGIQSMYFHLSRPLVDEGQFVEKGDVIALSGSSGRVTGPHLHFGIRLNGERINPLKLIEISKNLERR